MTDAYTESVAELLDEAAEDLETNGWCRKAMHDAQGRSCVMGAITRVGMARAQKRAIESSLVPLGWAAPAINSVAMFLGKGKRPEHIATWNDKKGRTTDEAIDLLKGTAKALRNGELKVATDATEVAVRQLLVA